MTSTESVPRQALTVTELQEIDRYWRAANYLSVGQIYLQDNPLLREPLVPEHIKPRLLGHWGTTPGLNFIYAHLNHQIRSRGTEMMWIVGPGHGGPSRRHSMVGRRLFADLSDVGRNAEGMRRLFRQFSFPGGVPSHAAPETPAPSTKAASSATRSPTLSVQPSTTPTWLSPRSSGTVKPKPAPCPEAGSRSVSSTRRATAQSCRSCTSTATRSPGRPCWPASPRKTCWPRCAGTATNRMWLRATTRTRSTS